MLQHVTLPTLESSNAVLDRVFTSFDTPIEDLSVNEEFGTSGHSIVQFSVNVKTSIHKKSICLRDSRRTDWSLFEHLYIIWRRLKPVFAPGRWSSTALAGSPSRRRKPAGLAWRVRQLPIYGNIYKTTALSPQQLWSSHSWQPKCQQRSGGC